MQAGTFAVFALRSGDYDKEPAVTGDVVIRFERVESSNRERRRFAERKGGFGAHVDRHARQGITLILAETAVKGPVWSPGECGRTPLTIHVPVGVAKPTVWERDAPCCQSNAT